MFNIINSSLVIFDVAWLTFYISFYKNSSVYAQTFLLHNNCMAKRILRAQQVLSTYVNAFNNIQWQKINE